MTEMEIVKLVKTVIRQELAPILMGRIVSADSASRSTFQRFPTDSPNAGARNIQPYGLRSMAPAGMPTLVVPINSDPSHLNVVGHFDETNPPINAGETVIYNQWGQTIYLKNGKIQIGSESASQPLVLGNIHNAMMSAFLELVADHTHPAPGYPPTNKADFLALKASPVDDRAQLSDENFTEK